jgi:hypothetical protein
MRRTCYYSIFCGLAALSFATAILAQGRGGGRGGAPLARLAPSDKKFDPHDLAGIWTRSNAALGWGGGSTCPDCGDRGFGNDTPPFTPLGQKMFDANKPSYGRSLGTPDAAAHPEEHIGRRRAVPPSNGTDPYQYCNPEGVTRALIYPDPIEFVQLPDRIYQHYMWGYGIRPIWTDGRKLPDDPDQPRWWGYSVGHWEGDTFVVNSTGHDQRTWVDHFGYPHSEQMHLEERYRRTNYNTLELNWTITDPTVYTKPWIGQTKRFHLVSNIKTVDGFDGMLEDVCAPADEVDQFDKRIRDPAGARP